MTTILLIGLAAPPALPVVVKADPDDHLNAAFRPKEGWIGGDGAFSVPLSAKRTLWLFSDTWVGRVRDGRRQNVQLVNNTVAVQDGNGPHLRLTFFVHKKANKPVALFTPPDGKGWFWLFAGYYAGGKLYVFLPRFDKSGEGAFGFQALDMWLGTVANPNDEPTRWTIAYTKMPFADFGPKRKLAFGVSVWPVGDYAYVYGYVETPGPIVPARRLLTARVPNDKVADFSAWRFYANGQWKPDMKDATEQAGGLGAEFSVSYVPGLKRYALVTTENGLSNKIVGRFAPSPEGPWTEPVLLYTCPEMNKDRKVFTYAGKAHPHLATDSELVISYATNAFELGPVLNQAELYWPTFVRVQLK